ncbi:DNA-directed RNA polymerase subunit sigma [Alkalihalobacillus pseudalcaliphilus]|nr:sigma-70 family RNA polymerase sigma factor [Alkalihalobacillus pseudalcaliphilus]KMK75286.1 DNA-directed RNA polymerase subunit sigma [Alkalihalobacillus pseudalcaliphilus]
MEELVMKAQKGDEKAFQEIVEQYRVHVIRTIIPIVKNVKDAEDLAQDVFVRVYYALPQYEARGFKTWLTRIAVNMAIDEKRKQKRRNEEALENWEGMSVSNELEEKLLKKETKRLLHEKLESVPENYRNVLVAFYIEEKSYQEIAREQMVEVKTIETKLYRARKWVKERWKEEDFR